MSDEYNFDDFEDFDSEQKETAKANGKSAKSYARNVLKSAKYIGLDVIKNFDPDIRDFLSDTANIFTDMYDTVENARLSGYLKDGMSFCGKDGKFDINQDIYLKYAKNHVIIADAESVIYPPYKVMYYSEGVTIREDGSIDPVAPADKNQKIVLILKK